MKKTYTGTLLNPDLAEATINLYVYDECKYSSATEGKKIQYTGVTSWDLISGGAEAEEIEASTDASGVDDYHEYLVLHFENGETATFRNSYVDMFIR